MTTLRHDLGAVVVALAAVAGVRLGEAAGPHAATAAVALGAVALVVAWAIGGTARLAVAAAGVALLGCGSMSRALDGLEHHALAAPAAGGVPVAVRGTVAADPDLGAWSVTVLVRADELVVPAAGDPAAPSRLDRIVLVRAASDDASRFRVLAAGDRVEVSGDARPLRAAEAHLRWRHVVGVVSDARLRHADDPGLLFATANAVRDLVGRGTSLLAPDDGALARGLLLGDTRLLPDDLGTAFRDAGLSHLLAVSGANVAFVLALAGPLLRRLRLGARTLVTVAILAAFALVTRWEPSVLRAAVMAGAATAAVLAGRPVGALRLLAGTVAVLLVADPFLVHSLGFGLSCAATAGIVVLAPGVARRLPLPGWLRAPLAVTVAAQLGVLPVLVVAFGSVPLVAPVANLVAAPIAEPITVLGLPGSAVAGALAGVAEPVARMLMAPSAALVAALRGVARVGAAVPGRAGADAVAGALAIGALVAAGRRIVRP